MNSNSTLRHGARKILEEALCKNVHGGIVWNNKRRKTGNKIYIYSLQGMWISKMSEEALQIAVKGRKVKNKWEEERYTHLNAEFQRIARRDKKAFFSDQWKEIEGNNRMEKTRDLFKKIRDTKGTFHAKMGSIKGRNCMDLTEADFPWWLRG